MNYADWWWDWPLRRESGRELQAAAFHYDDSKEGEEVEGVPMLTKTFRGDAVHNIFSANQFAANILSVWDTPAPRLKFHSGLIDRWPSNQQPLQFGPIHLWPATAANSLALSTEPQKWPKPIAWWWEQPDASRGESEWGVRRRKKKKTRWEREPAIAHSWTVCLLKCIKNHIIMTRLVFLDSGQYHG